MSRTKPNIVVTGTPGVGKTSLCESLVGDTGLQHLSINRIAKERECHDGWDEEMDSWIIDEDKTETTRFAVAEQQLLDAIEDETKPGGCLIDWHACDLFPESWVDLVVVLRSDSSILYDRLKARDYSEKKLQENMDAEIMEVLLTEAREAFEEEMVVELWSNGVEDMEGNVARIEAWIESWMCQEGQGKRREVGAVGGEGCLL
ncbi:MAG: hypothetical protein LQ346_000242 [Caloplaca aetnensis]|nr:MAG: hypothetical protein LQ346_000242 [Caloplaca aetnensis]